MSTVLVASFNTAAHECTCETTEGYQPIKEIDVGDTSGFNVSTAVFISKADYSFQQRLVLSNGTSSGVLNFDAEGDSNNLGLNLSVAYDEVYLVLQFESTIDASMNESVKRSLGPSTALNFSDESSLEQAILTLTLGWNITDRVTLFAGIKEANNSFESSTANTGTSSLVFASPQDKDFEVEGLFIGSSYQFNFEHGTFSLSAAYSALDGIMTQKHAMPITVGSTPAAEQWIDGFAYEGDTTGVSLSASWLGVLNENIGYFVQIKQQSYDYGYDESITTVHAGPITFSSDDRISGSSSTTDYKTTGSTTEDILSFNLGLNYFF